MRYRSIPLIAIVLLLIPVLSLAEVTLVWDESDPSTEEYHLYQSTTAPVAACEVRTIPGSVSHTIVTSPYSVYMDDAYVDAGVVYADTGTPLLRETTPALSIDYTTPANVASIAFYYHISGVQYTKAAVTGGTVPGDDVIPQGKYGAVAFDIAADGVIDVIEAAANATGYDSAALAVAGIPDAAAGHVRMGTVTASKSDGAFTFGTTAFNAANVTTSFNMTPITLDAGEYELYWFDNAHEYYFHPADAGVAVRISYSYTPIVRSHERYTVPASQKIALAHKPTNITRTVSVHKAGEKARLTTAGVGSDGIATFDAADVGETVDISYAYTQSAVTKTEQVTLPASVGFSAMKGTFAAERNAVLTAERIHAGTTQIGNYSYKALLDPVATFTRDPAVQVGDVVTDLVNNNTATVTSVGSTSLSLSANIFNNSTYGHDYIVLPPSGSQAMTKVSTLPAAGQYAVDDNGNYTFNAADGGKIVLLDYTRTIEGDFTRKAVISGRNNSYTLRNPAGTYYLRLYGLKNGSLKSKPSNIVSYTQATDDARTMRLKIGNGRMQKTTSQSVTVGH